METGRKERVGGGRKERERGSIECLEELWKRKREDLERSGEGEEIFKKSKIIERSLERYRGKRGISGEEKKLRARGEER